MNIRQFGKFMADGHKKIDSNIFSVYVHNGNYKENRSPGPFVCNEIC